MATYERRNSATGHADGRATTPFIFALATTGILVAMWSLFFFAWLHKRWKRARRRAGKPGLRRHKREHELVKISPPTYIVPPDPAVFTSGGTVGQGGDLIDPVAVQELFGKEHIHKDHRGHWHRHSKEEQSNPTLP